MDRLVAMQAFVRVVEAGSFARAAARLGMSNAAVTRHVAGLEQHLGTRLLHRSTRRLSLTDTGAAYHERCQQLLAELDEAEAAARSTSATPRGVLRLNAPVSFSVLHLAPLLPEFLAAHPELTLDVSLSDRVVDLVEEGYDIAIRIGRQLATTLVARRLAGTRVVPCAAPAYLARHVAPRVPDDLAQHACLTYSHWSTREEWRLDGPGGRSTTVAVRSRYHANNGDLLRRAALDGAGIAMQPSFIVGPDLAAGRLVRVLPDWEPPPLGIHAVYASRRHLSPKVRACVDFLAQRIADPAPWDRMLDTPTAREERP